MILPANTSSNPCPNTQRVKTPSDLSTHPMGWVWVWEVTHPRSTQESNAGYCPHICPCSACSWGCSVLVLAHAVELGRQCHDGCVASMKMISWHHPFPLSQVDCLHWTGCSSRGMLRFTGVRCLWNGGWEAIRALLGEVSSDSDLALLEARCSSESICSCFSS